MLKNTSAVYGSFYVDEQLQYSAGAGAGAGAKIMATGGAKKEPEPKINNFGSATPLYTVFGIGYLQKTVDGPKCTV